MCKNISFRKLKYPHLRNRTSSTHLQKCFGRDMLATKRVFRVFNTFFNSSKTSWYHCTKTPFSLHSPPCPMSTPPFGSVSQIQVSGKLGVICNVIAASFPAARWFHQNSGPNGTKDVGRSFITTARRWPRRLHPLFGKKNRHGRGWKMILLIFGVIFRFQLLVSGGIKML